VPTAEVANQVTFTVIFPITFLKRPGFGGDSVH
jgi:hypothetical protein